MADKAPSLPSLQTFLRRPAREMAQQLLSLWQLMGKTRLLHPSPPPATPPPRNTKDLDAAYLWVLANTPGLGEAASCTLAQMEDSQRREAAWLRMRGALSDLGQGLMDSMGLLRAGLYTMRVRAEQKVAAIRATPGAHHGLAASWSLVEEAQARTASRAQKGRARAQKLRATLSPMLLQAEAAGEEREAIERLLTVSSTETPRRRPLLAAEITTTTAKALAAPRSGRRSPKKNRKENP